MCRGSTDTRLCVKKLLARNSWDTYPRMQKSRAIGSKKCQQVEAFASSRAATDMVQLSLPSFIVSSEFILQMS